jgi:hypothetical protein
MKKVIGGTKIRVSLSAADHHYYSNNLRHIFSLFHLNSIYRFRIYTTCSCCERTKTFTQDNHAYRKDLAIDLSSIYIQI